ncbi:pupal cuticle protein 36a-like [Wyeomyia smithii]|uniref:pupal cuticle protein 36a-like n=1 Tax=Wyeomyia smithii TaxID=174621 RepID=UPI0024681D0C|nr:pupal cuticle protein 36a-like [Wyeomyia smithii]
MIRKTILWCALIGNVLAARLDNLYGAPAPPGASRGGEGDGNFLNAPRQDGQFGGAPSNQYLPPTGQASNQPGYLSVAPLGGGQAQNQFGYDPQSQQQPQQQPQRALYSPQPFGGFGGSQPGAGGFQGGYQGPRTTPIPILRYENVNNGDGSYRFDYATGNGIQHQEEGYNRKIGPELGEQIVTGGYSYTGPDGKLYSIQYKADAGGFQPVGDHLPTPPPLPQELQEAYNLHAKLYAEAAARPKNPAYQGPQGYDQQQPGQQYGAPQPQYQSPGSQQFGAPHHQQQQQPQPQYQTSQQPQYQTSQQPQFQNTASSVQGYPSAPSNQYLPPTNRQQGFSPSSGYQY